jgi:hypothetical protein
VKPGDLFPAFAAVDPSPQSSADYQLFARDWIKVNADKSRDVFNTFVLPDPKTGLPANAAGVKPDISIMKNAVLANKTFSAIASPIVNRAQANANFTSVPAPAANAAYTAKFSVDGSITKEVGVNAYAFSEAAVFYNDLAAVLKKAKVKSNPSIAIGRAGTIMPKIAFITDPVGITVLDSSGTSLFTDQVMNVFMATKSDASATWDLSGAHLVTGTSGQADLHVTINPLYVLPGEGGNLDLEITNGIVTQSDETGAFSSFSLPSYGSPVTSWDLPFGSAGIAFDLSIDSILAGLPAASTITIDSQNAGLVEDDNAAAPEPGSMILLLSGLAVCGLLYRRAKPAPGSPAHA